ncbi:MAG: amidohydrolase family protein [Phycisphaerales bacterium JB043]
MKTNTLLGTWLRGACAGVLTIIVVLIGASPVSAGDRPINGIRPVQMRWDALVGGTLVASPGVVIENATVVMRDGVIESVGSGTRPAQGARVWDVSGKTIYAGFIEPHVPVGAPMPDTDAPGVHWNSKVTPQRRALDGTGLSSSISKSLRELGFGAAAISPEDGVFRGRGALVSLRGEQALLPSQPSGFQFGRGGNANRRQESSSPFSGTVYADDVYIEVAMEQGGFGGGGYPTSNMGAVAVIRQILAEADWYDASSDAEYDASLEALGPGGDGGNLLLFNADQSELELMWASEALNEFDRDAILLGEGTEYRRVEAIASLAMPVIVPLVYPETPGVGSMAEAETYSLHDLMSWEQAPTNARRLVQAGVTAALTTDKLESRKDFWANLRKAIEHGLSEDDALAMITTTPAELLGVDDKLGRVEEGYIANLVVVDGSIFEKDAEIRSVWIDGVRHEISSDDDETYDGVWDGQSGEFSWEYHIDGDKKVTLLFDDQEEEAKSVKRFENRLSFRMPAEKFGIEGFWLTTLVFSDDGQSYSGVTLSPDGSQSSFAGSRVGDLPTDEESGSDEDTTDSDTQEEADEPEKDEDPTSEVPEDLPSPFGAYGFFEAPEQEDVAIINATIWTGGADGIIENGAMIVEGGKITWIGSSDDMPTEGRTLRIVDAEGMHVSPGIIDAHSHTGIGASFGDVNEVGQPVTAEARVFDIINPDDINWYRQLAGGVTAANQLHGSANVIGGQNSVVKNRWGSLDPREFRLDGATPGIKYALGENPKRDTWRYLGEARYPQTRMGVGALIRERFEAAQDYTDAKQRGDNPKPDMELEALAEILSGERLIHCHSYRQDEIFLLAQIAKEYGFTIGTFQHVLEGYKVAEAIKETALGASSFSDWWAYKFEVIDAIPYNGAIMHEVGVSVSFNSDSNELARRLNTEATKAVKYGGVDEHSALQFVTLNPAIQLDLEDRIGSLEVGKDADFVIWTDSPLSTFARASQTWVDGTLMYSIERDRELRDWVRSERQRILRKIFEEGGTDKGGGKRPGMGRRPGWSGGDRSGLMDARMRMIESYLLEHQLDGLNGTLQDCGECGIFDGHMGGAH